MKDGTKILTTILICAGFLYLINHVPQLRHLIKGETLTYGGQVIRDPRSRYASP